MQVDVITLGPGSLWQSSSDNLGAKWLLELLCVVHVLSLHIGSTLSTVFLRDPGTCTAFRKHTNYCACVYAVGPHSCK